ncbi:MAG: SH3 domain-containing protein [Myxococcales bacterium]
MSRISDKPGIRNQFVRSTTGTQPAAGSQNRPATKTGEMKVVDGLDNPPALDLRARTKAVQRPPEPGGPTMGPPQRVLTTSAVNLRPSPGTAEKETAVIPPNTPLTVTPDPKTGRAKQDGFVHVSYTDVADGKRKSGWVSEQYVTPMAPPPRPGETLYSKDLLNLRGAPEISDGNLLQQLPPGATLTVTRDARGRTEQNGFVHVSTEVDGKKLDGWVFESFTTSTQPSPTQPTTPTTPATPAQPTTPTPPAGEYVVVNTTGNLNLRAGATTSSNVLGKIPNGTRLEVTPDANGVVRKDGFVHVKWDDKGTAREGWVSEQYTASGALADAAAVHVNQLTAEQQVVDVNGDKGDGRNANCGPASVVIALRDQGLQIPGIPGIDQTGDGADVQAARYWAVGPEDRDGVVVGADGKLHYADLSTEKGKGENSQYTMMDELEAAAQKAGATTGTVGADADSIKTALDEGKAVVVLGTFLDDQDKAKTGVWDNSHGATEHFVTVTGMTPDGKYIVSDPLQAGPIAVSADQLNNFMTGNGQAMSVSR